MSQSSRVLRNSCWLMGGQFAARAITVGASVYVARTVGVEGFGLIGLTAAFAGHFEIFLNRGLNTVGVREISSGRVELMTTVEQVFSLRVLFLGSTMVMITACNLAIPNDPLVKTMIVLRSLGFLSWGYATYWVFQAKERMAIQGIGRVIAAMVYSASIFLFIKGPDHVILVPLFSSLAVLTGPVPALVKFLKEHGRIMWRWEQDLVRTFLRVSIPMSLAGFADVIMLSTGIWVLKFVSDPHQIGLYNAGFRFFMIVYMILGTAVAVLYPVVASAWEQGIERFTRLHQRMFGLLGAAAIGLLFGTLAIGSRFIPFIFGDEFAMAGATFQVLMAASALHIFAHPYGIGLLACGKQRQLMWLSAAGAALVVGITYFFGPSMGALGLAWAMFGAFALRLVWSLAVYSPLVKTVFPVRLFVRQLLAGFATFAVLMLFRQTHVLVSIIMGPVIFVVSCFVLGVVKMSDFKQLVVSAGPSRASPT